MAAEIPRACRSLLKLVAVSSLWNIAWLVKSQNTIQIVTGLLLSIDIFLLRSAAPYEHTVGVAEAFKSIQSLEEKVAELEQQVVDLQNTQRLFSMNVGEFKSVKWYRLELGRLRELWSHISLVEKQIEKCERTRWDGG